MVVIVNRVERVILFVFGVLGLIASLWISGISGLLRLSVL
jgi:hypothetical protein